MIELKEVQQDRERRGKTVRFETKSDVEIQFTPSAWDAEYEQFSPDHHDFVPSTVEDLFTALRAASPEGHRLERAMFFAPIGGFPRRKKDGFFHGEIEVYYEKA